MNEIEVIGILAAFAVGMVLVTAFTIRWAALAHTALRAAVVAFLLLMMTGMLAGAAIYFARPGGASILLGLWVASALMSLSVVIIFVAFLREARTALGAGGEYRPLPLAGRGTFQATVIAAVFGNELLMGWTFDRAAGANVWLGGAGWGGLASQLFVSPWFVLPMALEMACSLAWLRSEFPRPVGVLLAIQPIVMFASPPTLPGLLWVLSSAVVASAGMIAAVAYLLVRLFRGASAPRPFLVYAAALYTSFGLMGVGLAVWALGAGVAVYSVSVAAQMLVFLVVVLNPLRYRPLGPGAAGPIGASVSGRPSGDPAPPVP
jgi:hypothetical protein